jgi:hypothetical protein
MSGEIAVSYLILYFFPLFFILSKTNNDGGDAGDYNNSMKKIKNFPMKT